MQTPQQQVVTELKTELEMRRKVWRRVAGSKDQFIDPEHQRRYNLMVLMLDLYSIQTDREFNLLIDRLRRKEEAETAQTTLF